MNVRAVVLAAALGAAASSPVDAQQLAAEVLVDRDLTVASGVSITAAIGELVGRAEAHAVPDRLFAEEGTSRRTANVSYRIAKHVLFDAPQEHLLLVVDHELFGHGARLSERFDGPIEYRFHIPAPYGSGGADTAFVFDRPPTMWEQLAVSAGGMESTTLVASIVSERAFVEGRLRSRDALRYLTFELDSLRYIASAETEGFEAGHDVGDFLRTYNDLAAVAGASKLTARTLRNESLVGLANPMAAYAIYGIARYWWSGSPDVAVPALSINGVRYLPLVRYRLTPFGTEWALVNSLGGRVRPMEIELRVGRSPNATPWGIGLRQRQVVRFGGWAIDAAFDVWKQPPVDGTDPRQLSFDPRPGSRVRGRVHHPLRSSRATFIIEVGGKSGGYIPGEPLRGGFVARAGIGVPVP